MSDESESMIARNPSDDPEIWKALAIRSWAESAIVRNDDELRESGAMRYAALMEVDRMKSTFSWRLTAPLRAVRSRLR